MHEEHLCAPRPNPPNCNQSADHIGLGHPTQSIKLETPVKASGSEVQNRLNFGRGETRLSQHYWFEPKDGFGCEIATHRGSNPRPDRRCRLPRKLLVGNGPCQ